MALLIVKTPSGHWQWLAKFEDGTLAARSSAMDAETAIEAMEHFSHVRMVDVAVAP